MTTEATNAQRMKGLIAAPFTPMARDGSVDLDKVGQMADHLRRNGITGVFVCGTTGESLSLTAAERKAVVEAWMAASDPGLAVIAHVGHPALEEAQALAGHAESVGVRAIGAMAPPFFKPATVVDLTAYCRELCAAAPQTPFYYYHIPSMTHVSLSMVDFLDQAADAVPTLAGIKYTHTDLVEFDLCLTYAGGRYEVLAGRDQLLLASLAFGALSAVGSTYNFSAPIFHRLIRAFENGDFEAARAEQRKANEIIRTFEAFGGLAAQKAIMGLIGVDCGPVRPPLRPLDAKAVAALASALERIGFFESVGEAVR